MEVILLERVDNLGGMGEVVKVKPGYARNYLLPKKKALRATKDNMAQFEAERAALEAVNTERRTAAEAEGKKLDGSSFILVRQAGEAGQLYGSVNARDIANTVSESGIKVDRSQIRIPAPIKTIGIFTIGVNLHPEVSVSVTINVARSAEEAKTQAKTGHAVLSEAEKEAAKVFEKTPDLEEIFEEVPQDIEDDEAEDTAEDGAEDANKTE